MFVKSRHWQQQRSRAWPWGQEVMSVRRQKPVNGCVCAVWEALWEPSWHVTIYFLKLQGWEDKPKKWLACWETRQHSHGPERGRLGGGWKADARQNALPFRWEKILVKWHKWQPASSSITANKSMSELSEQWRISGDLFWAHRKRSHTDGSSAYSNRPCSVDSSLHSKPLLPESLHEWSHPLHVNFNCALVL